MCVNPALSTSECIFFVSPRTIVLFVLAFAQDSQVVSSRVEIPNAFKSAIKLSGMDPGDGYVARTSVFAGKKSRPSKKSLIALN